MGSKITFCKADPYVVATLEAAIHPEGLVLRHQQRVTPSHNGCGYTRSTGATSSAPKLLGLKFGGGGLKNRWSCFSIATHCQLINASCN